ncbi:MAG: hypothetical protein AB7S75_03500 [Desulfococcaceae bacterium]
MICFFNFLKIMLMQTLMVLKSVDEYERREGSDELENSPKLHFQT